MSNGKQWITAEVELPQELLDTHREGRVVFFVGAGASKAPPSSLPLFEELVISLGVEAGKPYIKPNDGLAEPLDRFLGGLTHLVPPYEVHKRVHAILTDASTSPNAWHDATVRLADAYGKPRIVTTNFDDHLDAAALSAGVSFPDKWIGPALPLGQTAIGLVHLHGSVTRGHGELVLTDKDLGQAYLSEAWATRFLLKLFQDNVVVFIGYGLTDPTMRYLTLGMPSGSSLYAFTRTSESTNPDWARLGVTPIPFGEDYDNVPKALNAWYIRARMGQLDHRSRVETLVGGGTSLPPVDRDYLEDHVSTPEGAQDLVWAVDRLTNDDTRVEWLTWAESHPAFQELFAPREVSEAAQILGDWFARSFIASPKLHGVAFQTVMRLGQTMSNTLFRSSTMAVWKLEKADSAAAEKWQAFLSTSVFRQTAPLTSELLLPFHPDARAWSTVVLRATLRPYLRLQRRWFSEDEENSPYVEVEWPGKEYALTRHLLLAVHKAPAGDQVLGGVLEQALLSAYDLFTCFQGDRDWDPFSFGRAAIEQHEQDNSREPIDAIIDALREYGTKARSVRPDLPERWWALEYTLFRRLALHLVATDSSRTADSKLEWFLSHSGPYTHDLKHEAFQLLKTALPQTSDDLKSQVLVATKIGPDLPDGLEDRERQSAYTTYNLLVWLKQSAPDWTEASDALSALQAEYPSFLPREHPDLNTWTSFGTRGRNLPIAPEDFVALLEKSPAKALDALLAPDYSERRLEDPSWDDALELVRQVVGKHPGLGFNLWHEADGRSSPDTTPAELQRAIIAGWSNADLGESADGAVAHTTRLLQDPESADEIGEFALKQIQRLIESDETVATAALRGLAKELWDSQGSQFSHSYDGLLSAAPLFLNSWPGFLAQYWPREIDRRWRHNRDNWTGLNDAEKSAILALLKGPRQALDATQPAICSVLPFLFAADEQFTIDHVLPLFSEPDSAILAWHAYLHSPRWNDRLLAAGLLESMCELWEQLDQLGDQGDQQRFFHLVMSILSWAGIDEDARRRLLTQSVIAAEGAHAVAFAAAGVWFFAGGSVDGGLVWDRWLGDHLSNRLEGIPRTASSEELSRWADVVPHLGDAIPRAVQLFARRDIGLYEEWLSPDIPDSTLEAHGEVLVHHFAERLTNTNASSMMLSFYVQALVSMFCKALGDDTTKPLVQAVRERGLDTD